MHRINTFLFQFFSLIIFTACFKNTAHTQVVINEVSTTNLFFYADEDGDYPDWVELYNNGLDAINLHGYAITDDADWNKWIFPDIMIYGGERLFLFASGKNRVPADGAFTVNHYETALFDTDMWNYFIGDSEPPADWNTLAFAGAWASAEGGFGYGDGDDNTIVPVGTSSVYFRNIFNVADTSDIINAILSMDYDDAFVAYINGVEIARNNISGTPAYNTPADADHEALLYAGAIPEQYTIDYATLHSVLQNGNNVLAVEIHNISTASSDLTGRAFLHFGIHSGDIYYYDNPAWFSAPVSGNILHTNFKISTGETLKLYNAAAILLDSANTTGLLVGNVLARIGDGADWCISNTPTPNAENTGLCYVAYSTTPTFSLPGGFYDTDLDIEISGVNIYYTTDGSEPTALSLPYISPIHISATSVVRARCFEAGKLPGAITSATYFIHENTSLPVVSVIAEPGDLFYGYGGPAVYDNSGGTAPCHFEYYDTAHVLQFSQNASITPVGNYSIYFDQKSLQFKFDEDYGATENMTYNPFINDKPYIHTYAGFRVRNMDDDWAGARMRDLIVDRMALPTFAASAGYQNMTVFINGIYWGHLAGRELLDGTYCENNFGSDPDSVDIIKTNYGLLPSYFPEEGTDDAFYAMSDFLINNDMASETNYDSALQLIDYKNWVDYWATEVFIENEDWYSSYFFNNTRLFKSYSPDVKWKFILWDCSDGQFDPSNNILQEALGSPYTPNRYTDMFNSLLNNTEFKNYFINRFADLINYYFTTEKIIPIIENNANEIAPEINRQSVRWGSEDSSSWVDDVNYLKYFYTVRQDYVRNHIKNYFDMAAKVDVTLDVNPVGAGHIKISTIIPENLPWTGIYFNGNPVSVTAIANPGYVFSNWTDNEFIANPDSITFNTNITSATTFTANFTGADAPTTIAISELNYHSDSTLNSGDWVELYNYGAHEINISDWQLQDADFFHRYTIPTGTILHANDRYVIVCDSLVFNAQHPDILNTSGNTGFNFNNNGENISLYDAFNATQQSFIYSDIYNWPITADGYGRTLEKTLPGADANLPESWFAGCMQGSPGEAYSPCDENPIISEINYNASSSYDAGDWIELYNKNYSDFDLSGWRIRDKNDSNTFVFPDGTFIQANNYLILTNSNEKFTSIYPTVVNKIGDFNFGFGSNGDIIQLINNSGQVVFTMYYTNATPWPNADGNGYTLECYDYNANMNDASNWFAGCLLGSPGTAYTTPCTNSVEETASENISIYPNPASKYINVYAPTATSDVYLYDITGKLIYNTKYTAPFIKINIENLTAGIYMIEIRVKENIYYQKLVKY